MLTTPTILLFDVDGTLLTAGGAGRRALVRAFVAELGRGEVVQAIDLRGMTDPAVFREAVTAAGLSPDPRLLARLVASYLAFLPEELDRAASFTVLPGVRQVVAAARACPGVAVGLGTGNYERGARLKLARGELSDDFPFGGFGDDAEARAEVLRAGAERGARRLEKPLARCRVVVIGDTPRDVAAARSIGAESVAVATGGFDVGALRAAGATAVHESLAADGALASILGPAALR